MQIKNGSRFSHYTETIKYINENCFIDNLAASKYSMWQTNVIINVHFACSEEVS